MLKVTFCPNITMMSFVSIISIIDLIVFSITVVASIAQYGTLDPKNFLAPYGETFKQIDSNPYEIKCEY